MDPNLSKAPRQGGAFLQTNWKKAPKYVLLGGTGSYDPAGRRGDRSMGFERIHTAICTGGSESAVLHSGVPIDERKGWRIAAVIDVGDATTRAKAAVSDLDVRRTWILFGDPSMRLR